MKRQRWWSALIGIAFLTAACKPAGPSIQVSDAWGRVAPGAASSAAFYMVIENEGRQADVLTGADSSACGAALLHETVIDDRGVASMNHVDEITIPALTVARLEIGGLHVMCMDMKMALQPGDKAPITLYFRQSGEVVIKAEIIVD